MATSVAATTQVLAISSAPSDAAAERMYRLKKPIAAVQIDASGKGRIVFLPEGAELRVIGLSSLAGCLEVLCQKRLYNMFDIDLSGPRCNPIDSNPRETGRIASGRLVVAARACA